MACCATSAALNAANTRGVDAEWVNACSEAPDGTAHLVLSVPGISCGGCISRIERHLCNAPDVLSARVNLTLKRLVLHLKTRNAASLLRHELETINYAAHPFAGVESHEVEEDARMRHLVRALAVAGFAMGNIMLLSVSVWSGAMGPTRDLFHLVSAFIALPAAAYAGQIFYRSAFAALRKGQLNMDVPITLAIILALGMSLYEALTGGAEAYFDAAAMLLFFLLIGRTLDQMMRNRAQSAIKSLAHLAVKGADVVTPHGVTYLPLDEILPEMELSIPPGGRIPVDGTVVSGTSDLDRALVTGEADPAAIGPGMAIEAGTMNLTGPLILRADRAAEHSFLAEVTRMMEAAEVGRGQYRRIADRMAQIYAPAVHILAAITFLGWLTTGADWQTALYAAIAVLIVTCPCALGLAVPVTHVVAAGKLFESGTLMKDGSALERLAEADIALFDKTGTVTTGQPLITHISGLAPDWEGIAAALARGSSHPAAQAVEEAMKNAPLSALTSIIEIPGSGVEAAHKGQQVRLGRMDWVAEISAMPNDAEGSLAFGIEGQAAAVFKLDETLREGAAPAFEALSRLGFRAGLLSGDTSENVGKMARQLATTSVSSNQRPADKVAHIHALAAGGQSVMMVGDGLNDGPALRAAHVSMAPVSASDVGRMAADFVFTRESLMAVPEAICLARAANRIVRQNFALALGYNAIAVPLAMSGFVTPLIAAIAMSASSILVVSNSLRLRRFRPSVGSASPPRTNVISPTTIEVPA